MDFKVSLAHEHAKVPVMSMPGSAGFDLHSCESMTLAPNEFKMINTGIITQFPEQFYGRVAPRSGLALKGIDVLAGVIDCTYRNVIRVILINHSQTPFNIKIGDRIAQLIFEMIHVPILKLVNIDEMSETVRGEKGLGSTGV